MLDKLSQFATVAEVRGANVKEVRGANVTEVRAANVAEVCAATVVLLQPTNSLRGCEADIGLVANDNDLTIYNAPTYI